MSLVCDNLATKAELAELKEKINKLLGQKEDGGEINVLEEESLEGTTLGNAIKYAFNAIQDFGIGTESGGIVESVDNSTLEGLAAGTLSYVGVKGAKVTQKLPGATKAGAKAVLTIVKNKELAQVGAEAAKVSGASVALLSSLVNIVTTLGLSIAETDILGFRIDQTEKGLMQLHETQLTWGRIISQQNGDLNKAKSDLLKQKKTIKKQNKTINNLVEDSTNKQQTINALVDEINNANEVITELESQNEKLLQRIEDVEYDLST